MFIGARPYVIVVLVPLWVMYVVESKLDQINMY